MFNGDDLITMKSDDGDMNDTDDIASIMTMLMMMMKMMTTIIIPVLVEITNILVVDTIL